MKTSHKGLALIKEFEGLRLSAYPDPATGGEPWTIGFGRTKGVRKGMRITKEKADEFLAEDIREFERHVPHGKQREFDAMVSLCFNIGPGNFRRSSVRRHHVAGEHELAATAFLSWNKAAGKVMPGLVRRRLAEAKLYFGVTD